jgi:phosphoribosyl-ATP pyrophosphohydrolase/phosphoribosyl-AMP cyclohydrolase
MKVSSQNLDQLDFVKGEGLLTAVVQHASSGEVLMVGWMNREALEKTLQRSRAVFWSRSRQCLWEKGETSGHTLQVIEIHADCDRDTLLLLAQPAGPVCHEGTRHCFGDDALLEAHPLHFLAQLQQVVSQRLSRNDSSSYTRRLVEAGPARVAQKVGEEGVEVALAAVTADADKLVGESADLIYHLIVLLRSKGLGLEDVARELERRHKS